MKETSATVGMQRQDRACAAVDHVSLLQAVENPMLTEVAATVQARLKSVIAPPGNAKHSDFKTQEVFL